MKQDGFGYAFTLAEAIIVVAILAIISAIGFASYERHLVGTRDAIRIFDVNRAKTFLRTEKQEVGAYPRPGQSFQIVNSGATNIVAYQGLLDASVPINGITEYPEDPSVLNRSYAYSVTRNRGLYQIATILENNGLLSAYVEGDYKTASVNILPSLLLAVWASSGSTVEIASGVTTGGSNGSINRRTFIFNGGRSNLPYNLSGNPVGSGATFSGILAEATPPILGNARFTRCQEIYDAGYWIGAGEYQFLSSGGIPINAICSDVFGTGVTNFTSGMTYASGETFSTTLPSGASATISVTGSGVGTSDSKADPLCDANDIAIWDTSGNIQVWAACNVGATMAMNYGNMKFDGVSNDVLLPGNTGSLFQWGNKADLSTAPANANTTSRVTDCTASASTYSSGTLFVRSDATAPANDWCVTANNDLWGNTTNTSTARQWPCPSGYHVPTTSPTTGEWPTALSLAAGSSFGSICNYGGTNSSYQLRCLLRLPRSGYRAITNGTWTNIGISGFYWSNSPQTTNARYAAFNAAGWTISTVGGRALGLPVRCIKN